MIGFPLRLAVTFLILALFVPVAVSMVSDLEENSSAASGKAEAEKIADAAKRTYYSGVGSTDTVSVSLSSRSCLIIGGEGSDSYSISILFDDKVIEKVFLQRPSVKFLGEPIYLMGNATISMKCVIDNGVYGVRVSIID
jgi:ABC-type Fe3+-hydroxamate transport system substrate-binding protein